MSDHDLKLARDAQAIEAYRYSGCSICGRPFGDDLPILVGKYPKYTGAVCRVCWMYSRARVSKT